MLPTDAALLRALRTSSAPLLPSELAMATGLELPELSVRLDALAGAGFEIERHPTLGCTLRGSPDRLIADDIWSRLSPRENPLLREILVLAETGSTNDVAMRLGREGFAGGVLVLAEKQTAGRGRFGRRWESTAERGIWMSLLLEPPLPPEQWGRLTTWLAVSAAAAIEAIAPVRCGVKWPNDLQISGRKVAGMLVEIGARESDQRPFAVAGLGVNANHASADFPDELREIATSIRLAADAPVDRSALVARLVEELECRVPFLGSAFDRIIGEATRRSTVLGRWIQVRTQESVLAGEAEALDSEGRLLLRTVGGELQTLLAGEVSLRG